MSLSNLYIENSVPHIFTPDEEDNALRILESIQTAKEAALFLLQEQERGSVKVPNMVAMLKNLLETIRQSAMPFQEKMSAIKLPLACQSMQLTLEAICISWQKDGRKCKMKLQFELIPAMENAYMEFYFWAYVHTHADREKAYYTEELPELAGNIYINQAVGTGRYKYDVSFLVLAYNKLEYTKMCVESLLKNIPSGLNYELILWDNGSTDGTQAYFESKKPDKLLESRINWSVGNLSHRVFEGKYCFSISNDVVILPGAIENMLKCIQSDDRIAFVVPSTPNVSNLQAIPAQYQNFSEMVSYGKKNNVSMPYRWEARVRLCDPICLLKSAVFFSRDGLNTSGYLTDNPFSFPDDRTSLLLRRNGYKMMLAKDAYCHHFGSVTLKDEIAQQNEQKYYTEGRQEFYNAFGVDPWGTGSCFDPVFLDRVVGEDQGHTEILGINCGLGSNSLKIKEQIKEYCHNVDTRLSNITDDPSFLADLKGISDTAETVSTIKGLKDFLKGHTYQYIVWETPFLAKYKFKTVLNCCMDTLSPNGKLIIKLTSQARALISRDFPNRKELGNDWTICDCGECR